MEEQKKLILRSLRDNLVNFFIAFARLVFFWLPGGDITYGKALMAFHPIFLFSYTALFFILKPQHTLRYAIVMLSAFVVASQWLLGGCVITRAEQILTGEKVTILDPFLTLANIEVNRDTRNATTVAASTTVLAILIWCLFCDSLVA